MGSGAPILLPAVEWLSGIVAGLFTFLLAVIGYMTKHIYSKIDEHDKNFATHSEELVKLQESSVTEDKVRKIIKTELNSILVKIEDMSNKFDIFSDKLQKVIIKAEITSELQKAKHE